MNDLHEFLSPLNVAALNDNRPYNGSQMGSVIKIYEDEFPDLENIDIVIAGINEFRGAGFESKENAADAVRKKFYQFHY